MIAISDASNAKSADATPARIPDVWSPYSRRAHAQACRRQGAKACTKRDTRRGEHEGVGGWGFGTEARMGAHEQRQ